ncbi:MAG: protein kinase [Bdellovibrionota bacterium]
MPEQLPDQTHVSEPGEQTTPTPAGQPKPDTYLGQIIDGKYRVLSKLGAGGMGAVYKAEHSLMGRMVALKVLHPHLIENEELMKRFQHEARIASKLKHRNAITTYDFGIYQGAPYLAMEYVEGRTLNDLIAKTGPIPVSRIINIYMQICSALAQAHQLGIVHRDLKPDNIMLVPQQDGTETAILLDFGIAKMLSQQSEQSRTVLTQAGMFFGTPKYASPEQALEKTLDKRSDIYTLGVILYEALSGEVPFEAPSVMEVLMKQLNQEPIPLSKAKPELKLPEALDQLIMKCLKKNPDERFQSVEEFLEELKAIDAARNSGGNLRRGVIAGLILTLAAAGGAYAWTTRGQAPATEQAPSPSPASTPASKPTEPKKDEVSISSPVNAASQEQAAPDPNHNEPLRGLAQMLLKSVETDSTKRDTDPFAVAETESVSSSSSSSSASSASSVVAFSLSDATTGDAEDAENEPQPTPQLAAQENPTPTSTPAPNVTDALRKDMSAIDAGKKEAAKYYAEGRDLYKQRRYADAAAKFELATQYRSDAIGSFISLGNCYMKLGKSDKALTAFLTAVKIEPSYGPAHYSLAGYFATQGDTAKALESLKRAIQHDPRAKSFAADDPDFATLKGLPEFRALVR